tara:strand:- start:106712 stop:106831 length:120 start_codon:yes stop_codon:yes gene_type:complete
MMGVLLFFVQWRAIRRLILAHRKGAALIVSNDGPPAQSN